MSANIAYTSQRIGSLVGEALGDIAKFIAIDLAASRIM